MSEFNRILEQRLAQRNVEQAQKNLYEAQAYYHRLLQGQDAQNMMASYGIGEAPDIQNYQMGCGGGKPKAAHGGRFLPKAGNGDNFGFRLINLRKKNDQDEHATVVPEYLYNTERNDPNDIDDWSYDKGTDEYIRRSYQNAEPVTIPLKPVNSELSPETQKTELKPNFNTEAPFYFTPTPYNVKKWQGRDMAATRNAYTQVYGYHPEDEAWAKGLALAQAGIRDPEVDALLPRRVRNRSVGYMMMNSNPNYFNKPAEVTETTEGTDTAEGTGTTPEQTATETTEQTPIDTNPIKVEGTPATGTATTTGKGSGAVTGTKKGTVTGNQAKVQGYYNITQSEAQRIAEEAAKKQGASVEMSNTGYKPVTFEQYANHQQRVHGMAGVTSPYDPGNRYVMAVDENGRETKLYTPYYEMSKYYGKSYKDIDRAVYQAKYNQNSDLYDPDNVDQVLAYAKAHPNEYVYGNLRGRKKGYFKYNPDPAYNSSNHLKWYAYTLPQQSYGGDPYQRLPYYPDTIGFRTERLPLKKEQKVEYYPFQPL